MLHRIGSPLMSNNVEGHFFKIPYDGYVDGYDVEYFKAIYQIYRLFDKGIKECEMFKCCLQSHLVKTDNRYLNSPWSTCNDKDLCPYAMLWKHWNLSKYAPQIK